MPPVTDQRLESFVATFPIEVIRLGNPLAT
jgi:hypothetical protein